MNPLNQFDPTGLSPWGDANSGSCEGGLCEIFSYFTGPDKFNSTDEAAWAMLEKINTRSICEGKEYAGMICKDTNNKYFATEALAGSQSGSSPHKSACPARTSPAATYHTHGMNDYGYENDEFSPTDINSSKVDGLPWYLGTPTGVLGKLSANGSVRYTKNSLPDRCVIHAN